MRPLFCPCVSGHQHTQHAYDRCQAAKKDQDWPTPDGSLPDNARLSNCCGVWGFEDLVAIIKNPKRKEHKSMVEWLGGAFDPEEFDIEETNRILAKLR